MSRASSVERSIVTGDGRIDSESGLRLGMARPERMAGGRGGALYCDQSVTISLRALTNGLSAWHTYSTVGSTYSRGLGPTSVAVEKVNESVAQ